jgi:hypothetical protein
LDTLSLHDALPISEYVYYKDKISYLSTNRLKSPYEI